MSRMLAKPFRVLQVTPHYYPFMGGIETHVYEVAPRLAARNIEVTVLSTDPTGKLPPSEEVNGVKIERVRAWPAKRDYCFAPEIYQRIVKGEWDLVHCQGCHTLVPVVAMVAAWRAKIPYVLTFHTGGHSSSLRNALRGLQWWLLRPLLAHAKALVGVSQFEADLFKNNLRLHQQRFKVIPNGGKLPELEQPVAAAEGTLIISIGRLERYKGHQRIIIALPKVREQYPDARLLILGSGPYEPELRKLAKTKKVEDYVEIRAIPPHQRQQMAATLSSAHLVTLLSEYEAHSVAVMEALVLGRPVLVAATSGLRELAEQGLVRAIRLDSSATEIATAVVEQLNQPIVPTKFNFPTWEHCTDELVALYSDVLEEAA